MDGTRLGASELARHICIGAVSPVELVASRRPNAIVLRVKQGQILGTGIRSAS